MTKILQLKISLMGMRLPVWRRVLVKDSISFHDLHNIIQKVMGWTNTHLFEFDMGDLSIGTPQEDFGDEVQDAKKIKINKIFFEKAQKLGYTYDFGDCWEHLILIEDVLNKDETQRYPICIAGKRACPPEDCGGIGGYEEILEASKDKNHPEHEEWANIADPEELDIDYVNECLKRIEK
ncbi:MAG: plasmid pRiA4b ORF-3 family protein [Nanoarchaeota archaeon]|nr:plasmid pRiA4b ORF-3 family protein [Nanoarchaeota archaeon]